MSNSWFQFKEFRVDQGECAMKVTTDACIFGAWVQVNANIKRILDIGAGTGLLSLMLAQKCREEVVIDGVELDKAAAEQAEKNVSGSPWPQAVTIVNTDIRQFEAAYKYDLIISNPPFFISSLLSDDALKNQARHTLSLTYSELLDSIDRNLADGGEVAIILPMEESTIWRGLCAGRQYHPYKVLNVKHRADAVVKRVLLLMKKGQASQPVEDTLIIQHSDGTYTPEFIELLGPYYLNL